MREPIEFENMKDIRMIQSISGPMETLENMGATCMEELKVKQKEMHAKQEEE